ncbi:MAG: DJ-1 family glyoxalase III [bacterium]
MRKNKVLALVSNGVEEMELVIVVDVLRRAGIHVDIVSISNKEVQCSREVKIIADKTFDEIGSVEEIIQNYDAIYIPGGAVNAENLKNFLPLKEIITGFINNNKIVAAICAGPTVINHHFSLKDHKATCYPSLKDSLPNYFDQKVVIDGNFITSQGPATSFDLALTIVEKLKNPQAKENISEAILYKWLITTK